ncbi:hypothetical protein BaRGS_00010782 [Batillaria attramentaria]|uniref:Uncharacterized protein n=1 Tax=Batillaria attramentaria TaxID=370345 RepID=A0ABD0LFD9_9CAEN
MTSTRFPRAASFYIYSRIVPLDWPPSNNASSIFFLRYLDRSVNTSLYLTGIKISSPKIAFRPARVHHIATHDSTPFSGHLKKFLPDRTFRFLHYRRCKTTWRSCDVERVTDTAVLRFESQWLQALSRLPLHQLGFSQEHVEKIKQEASASENKTGH